MQGKTGSCLVLAGPWACGCAQACSCLALLRKCRGPFSEQLSLSGTDTSVGKSWRAPGPWMGSAQPLGSVCFLQGHCRVFQLQIGSQGHSAQLLVAGSQGGAAGSRRAGWQRERVSCTCLCTLPAACRSPGSFVTLPRLAPRHHLHPPRSFLMLTSCVTWAWAGHDPANGILTVPCGSGARAWP